jgi:hypothetical protein
MMHELKMMTVAELERYRLTFDPAIAKLQTEGEIEVTSSPE